MNLRILRSAPSRCFSGGQDIGRLEPMPRRSLREAVLAWLERQDNQDKRA